MKNTIDRSAVALFKAEWQRGFHEAQAFAALINWKR